MIIRIHRKRRAETNSKIIPRDAACNNREYTPPLKGVGGRTSGTVIDSACMGYVVDFMCKKLKLIIEVDGQTHDDPETKRRDIVRQRALENADCTMLRFREAEIFEHLNDVRLRIQQMVRSIERPEK